MTEIRHHPTLDGILVRSDGWIFLPKKKGTAEHWTQGSINHGYRKIGYNHKEHREHYNQLTRESRKRKKKRLRGTSC